MSIVPPPSICSTKLVPRIEAAPIPQFPHPRGGDRLSAMLLLSPLPCNRPDSGADGDSGEWTGEKKRRHLGPSLPSDTGEVANARVSSSSSDAREERVRDLEDPIINDEELPEYDDEELPAYDREELLKYQLLLSKRPEIRRISGELDLETQRQLYKRLVAYRAKAHNKLSKGESEATLLDGLADYLDQAVSVDGLHFRVNWSFHHLDKEEGGTVEWSFDGESKFDDPGDYHRLVLINLLPNEGLVYWNWKRYRSLFTTYEMDKDYVKFVEEMSSKLKGLKSLFGYCERSHEWHVLHSRGLLKALKIAKKYTHMNYVLVYTAYEEYIWRLEYDYLYREDKDELFFEIRKHVTNDQLTFEDALLKLVREHFVTRHEHRIQHALEKDSWCGLEEEYNSCVEGIPGDASEDEAKDLIRAAVWKFNKYRKHLHKYMERKMEIAKSIGLVNCQT